MPGRRTTRSALQPITPPLPRPAARVTVMDVMRQQPGLIGTLDRFGGLNRMDEHAARAVIAHFGKAPDTHAGFELSFMLTAQASQLLRDAFMPEVKRQNRALRADFQRGLPRGDVPYLLGNTPPVWWQAIVAAGHAVAMRHGSYALDTLDGLLKLLLPGDTVWIDQNGEMQVLAGPPRA